MTFIYHITTANQAAEATLAGSYSPVEFAQDGFVHCSYLHQIEGVANRFYMGKYDLVLLKINPATVSASVVDENLEGGAELFPHVYGPIPWASVVEVIAFTPDSSGMFCAPTNQ